MNKNFKFLGLPNSQSSQRPRRTVSTDVEVKRLCETRTTSRQLFKDLIRDHKNSETYKLSNFVTHDNNMQQYPQMPNLKSHRGSNPSVLGTIK